MIDSTAILARSAKIGKNVKVDAYVTIEDEVEIGDNTHIGSHAVIRSYTEIGKNNRIHEFAVIGGEPQSIHDLGNKAKLKIGSDNTIREFVTINRGTTDDRGLTEIGDSNYLMAYVHIGHDCVVGNNCVLVNGTNVAGHVTIDDYAFLSGFTLIHQSCRIGAHCMTGINTILRQDVAPFVTVSGNPASAVSINSRGLKKRGFEKHTISALNKVFKLYFRKKVTKDCLVQELDAEDIQNESVQELIEFLKSTRRGVVR